ncbi:MAG: hypothetical protein JO130_18295 [Solirubrobacterales bacterium]|nr:hypothetical protein [Solirubrobacterales bacterium]
MSLNLTRFSRNTWIAYLLVEIGLFLVANLTAKSASHPGTVSNVFFDTFIVGLVIAAALGITALVRSRRA